MKIQSMAPIVLLASATALFFLISCSSDPTFGEQIKGEGNEVAKIGKSWEKGNALIKKGHKLIKDGESMQRNGKKNVSKGEDLIKAGEKLKKESEAAYRARPTNSVAVPIPE